MKTKSQADNLGQKQYAIFLIGWTFGSKFGRILMEILTLSDVNSELQEIGGTIFLV